MHYVIMFNVLPKLNLRNLFIIPHLWSIILLYCIPVAAILTAS